MARKATDREIGDFVKVAEDIGGDGSVQTIDWAPVAGATAAEVQAASVTLSPSVVTETAEDVPVTDNGGWIVTVPTGKRVNALTLRGLKISGGPEITNRSGLGSNKLAVSFPPVKGTGWESPRFSVDPIPGTPLTPATLTGASFSSRVLTLSESVPAKKVRVSVVQGNSPQEFTLQTAEVSEIHLTTETPPRNIRLTGPDNTVLWQLPEFAPDAPSANVDIRAALEQALNARIKSKQPLQVPFTVAADVPARAFVVYANPTGALLRVHEGVLRTELTGDATALALGDPLDGAAPQSAIGDLTLKYAGIRILEQVSDAPPAPGAMVSGRIVGDADALKIFAPQAFDSIAPAKIGVIGRAAEDSELSLEFVSVTGDTAGPALGPPAVLKLPADNAIATCWVDVPKGVTPKGPVGLRVRANHGRFFWASNDQPLVRVAVFDPDPAGRPLLLGSATLKEITQPDSHEPRFSFPATAFRGAPPKLQSSLFLTVDISDLTLRYPR